MALTDTYSQDFTPQVLDQKKTDAPPDWAGPAPAGQRWDSNIQGFVPTGATPGANGGYQYDPNSKQLVGFGSPASAPKGGTPDYSTDQGILDQIAQWSKIPGVNPSTANDPNYWLKRIKETGGLRADNAGYWQNLAMRPEGAPEGGSGGSAAGGSSSGAGAWINTPSPSSIPAPDMPTAAARNPAWNAFYTQLLNRSNQSLAVNPNDPVIKAQTEAFRNEQTRGSRQNLAAIAEAAGPNTNIGAETRHAGELVGQNTAGFQAQLMGREVDARRQEIAQALAGMAGQLTTEESSRLRQEDQALQGRQLQLGTQLSSAQLALQNELGRQGANQQQWYQAFQDRGWGADQAQRAWDDQYKTVFG